MRADLPEDLDACTRAYLECAEFADLDEDSRATLDAWPGDVVWDDESIVHARTVCADFQASNADVLALADISDAQVGHDLWLTRNGHGAGFWERGDDIGQRLTDNAHSRGECYVELYTPASPDDGPAHLRLIA